jgi:topoisomerase-4 subunit B
MLNYCYPQCRVNLRVQRQEILSKRGLLDLLERKTDIETLSATQSFTRKAMLEFAFSHGNQYGEYSFVNGQILRSRNTPIGVSGIYIVKSSNENTTERLRRRRYSTIGDFSNFDLGAGTCV